MKIPTFILQKHPTENSIICRGWGVGVKMGSNTSAAVKMCTVGI